MFRNATVPALRVQAMNPNQPPNDSKIELINSSVFAVGKKTSENSVKNKNGNTEVEIGKMDEEQFGTPGLKTQKKSKEEGSVAKNLKFVTPISPSVVVVQKDFADLMVGNPTNVRKSKHLILKEAIRSDAVKLDPLDNMIKEALPILFTEPTESLEVKLSKNSSKILTSSKSVPVLSNLPSVVLKDDFSFSHVFEPLGTSRHVAVRADEVDDIANDFRKKLLNEDNSPSKFKLKSKSFILDDDAVQILPEVKVHSSPKYKLENYLSPPKQVEEKATTSRVSVISNDSWEKSMLSKEERVLRPSRIIVLKPSLEAIFTCPTCAGFVSATEVLDEIKNVRYNGLHDNSFCNVETMTDAYKCESCNLTSRSNMTELSTTRRNVAQIDSRFQNAVEKIAAGLSSFTKSTEFRSRLVSRKTDQTNVFAPYFDTTSGNFKGIKIKNIDKIVETLDLAIKRLQRSNTHLDSENMLTTLDTLEYILSCSCLEEVSDNFGAVTPELASILNKIKNSLLSLGNKLFQEKFAYRESYAYISKERDDLKQEIELINQKYKLLERKLETCIEDTEKKCNNAFDIERSSFIKSKEEHEAANSKTQVLLQAMNSLYKNLHSSLSIVPASQPLSTDPTFSSKNPRCYYNPDVLLELATRLNSQNRQVDEMNSQIVSQTRKIAELEHSLSVVTAERDFERTESSFMRRKLISSFGTEDASTLSHGHPGRKSSLVGETIRTGFESTKSSGRKASVVGPQHRKASLNQSGIVHSLSSINLSPSVTHNITLSENPFFAKST